MLCIYYLLENSWVEPRLCDYDGRYYCPSCHWNSTAVIPARVVHNWDFEERRVCRASKQLLCLMEKRPVLQLQQLNPRLFGFIEELSLVKVIRNCCLIWEWNFKTKSFYQIWKFLSIKFLYGPEFQSYLQLHV